MPSILETVGPRAGSAPLTYTLAETGTVDVMSIFAEFDGSGAGGTFRPVVTVRSQSGAILARCFPSDTVAAGDSADVTFAPFLRDDGAGSAGSTLETTDGSTTVDPTDTLEIGYGLVLTNPSTNVAHIALASVAVDYPSVVANITDLIAYWPMDDPIGDQSDDSGYAPTTDLVRTAGSTVATYQVAAPPVVVASGDTGGAVQFNYNTTTDNTGRALGDTFAATNATPKWAFPGFLPYSVSLWVKVGTGWTVPSNAAPVGLVSTQAPTGSGIVPGWGLFVYPPGATAGNLIPYAHRGGVGVDTDLFAPTYAQLTAGEWWQVGLSYDGNRMFLWLNGIPISSAATSVSVTGFQTIHVGSGDWNGKTNLFYGTIARVAIYARALTSAEWLQLALVA